MYRYFHQFKTLISLEAVRNKIVIQQSAFYESNRAEVLQNYRYILKYVPKLYARKLQQRSAYLEICHFFHSSKVLSSLNQTLSRTAHLRQFVSSLRKKDHSVIGAMQPARCGEYNYVKSFYRYLKLRYQ